MKRMTQLLILMLMLLVVYTILRCIFVAVHADTSSLNRSEFFSLFYWGFRLDFTALFYINLPFILLYFFLPASIHQKNRSRINSWAFSLINLPFIALNILDIFYFRYNFRRANKDLVYTIPASFHSYNSLFLQYWPTLIAFVLFIIGFTVAVHNIFAKYASLQNEKPINRFIIPLACILIFFLIARGTGSRPIGPSTPLLHLHPALQPAANNSTLNFIDSYVRTHTTITAKNYFTQQQLDSSYTIHHQFKTDSTFKKRNVVIFLLESFGADHLQAGPKKAYTPFFDSLLQKSLVCTNTFENGHESAKGVVAALASIPPFLDEPFYMSDYNSIPFNGIGTILKKQGYQTNFFLGADEDHFNFGKLCRMIGLDNYYSKEDYHHPEHDDGTWGIYDEFFFQYFAKKMTGNPTPFLSVLYNISSHPPFAIPITRRKELDIPGQDARQNSITYVDHCFRTLFSRLQYERWFQNTIFVFCSDHNIVDAGSSNYLYESLKIPFFIYDPQQPVRREINTVTQQLDLVPTILDKLNYQEPFMSFGRSIYRKQEGFSISQINGVYQLIDSSSVTGYDEVHEKVVYHYDYKKDPLLKNNQPHLGNAEKIRAVIQRFNNSLVSRELLVE